MIKAKQIYPKKLVKKTKKLHKLISKIVDNVKELERLGIKMTLQKSKSAGKNIKNYYH